jgi:hypothetical protein
MVREMRGLIRLTAVGTVLAAFSALAFGGCAALEGLSSITEQICAPDCDAAVNDSTTGTPGEDATQPTSGDAALGEDATLGEDTAAPPQEAGEDAQSSGDGSSGTDASDGSTTGTDAGGGDAGHDAGTTVTCGGTTCVANNATAPACSGSTCTYTCNAGALDCNKATSPDPDGCECNVPGATASQCCSTQCPIAHNYDLDLATAVGTFYDCVAAGTYNITVATDACIAYTGDASKCVSGYYCPSLPDGGGTDLGDQVCSSGAANCDCWTYNGSIVGLVSISTTTQCYCPQPGTAPHWN